MWFLYFLGVVGGLTVAVVASQYALRSAISLSQRLGLSRFVIGVTVMAIGTDLPEIANSIIASATGHGDVNVGDSIGSTVTQLTLIVGLLCLTGRLEGDRTFVLVSGALIVTALATATYLLSDDFFSRADGLTLVLAWALGTLYIGSRTQMVEIAAMTRRADVGTAMVLLGALAVVAAGAYVAVHSFIEGAEQLGMPEFLTSFFVLSLGTSLPELVIASNALRRGESGLALGDLIGASFVDSTLSLGIGPLLFPVALSGSAARGSLIATFVAATAIALLARSVVYPRSTGIALITLYALLYASLLT